MTRSQSGVGAATLLSALLLGASPAPTFAQEGLPGAQDDDFGLGGKSEPKRVSASLVREHAAVVPGTTATFGVHLQIKKDWHVYWGPNSGDTGTPTTVSVKGLPKGARALPVRWPAPKRYVHEGLVDFVYEGAVTLIVPVAIPKDAKPGSELRFKLSVEWLVCKETCVPEDATLDVVAKVAAKPGERLAGAALLDAARKTLPTKAPSDVSLRFEGGKLLIEAPKASELVWFPTEPLDQLPGLKDLSAKADRLAISYPAKAFESRRVSGLLALTRGKSTTYHWIGAPGPKSPASR